MGAIRTVSKAKNAPYNEQGRFLYFQFGVLFGIIASLGHREECSFR